MREGSGSWRIQRARADSYPPVSADFGKAVFGYDWGLGNTTAATYGNGASQALGYDAISRLSSLAVDLSGTANDLTKTFAYNPASQIVSETRSNDAYSQALTNGTQTTVTNGLNQLSTVNGTSAVYDTRGNMTTDPVTAKAYGYLKTNNQLSSVTSPFTSFSYDALDRLWRQETPTVTNYVSDGTDTIAEYDGSNVLQKRYAFDGTGWPLVQYDAAGNRSWMLPDERGSIVALANDSSAMTAINSYDEYGIPAATNAGTFQYASMMWLSRAGVYAPTFRAYGAHLGRFNQTDPIGIAGGINLYAYVGNDPLNLVDPFGLDDIAVNGCLGSHWYLSSLCTKPGPGIGSGGAASSAGPGEGRSGSDDKGQGRDQQNQCPAGPYTQYSASFGGTLAAFLGLEGSIQVSISLPQANTIQGLQLTVTGQATLTVGLGAFVGAGLSVGKGTSSGPVQSEVSPVGYAEGDLGWGPAIGGSYAASPTSSSGSVGVPAPHLGAGYGAYAGVGGGIAGTKAFKPLGCSS